MACGEPRWSCELCSFTVDGARWLRFVLALVLFQASWASAQENGANEPLIAAFVINQKPISFLDSSGQPAGFARDLTDAICSKLGRSVSYVPVLGRGEARELVAAHEVDFVVAIFGTMKQARWSYSAPIVELSNRIFVMQSRDDIRRQADLRGSKTGCLSKAMAHRFENRFEGIECIVYETVDEALGDLVRGKLDAIAAPEEIVVGAIERDYSHRGFKMIGSPERALLWYFAVPAGNEDALSELDMALTELRDEGEYESILFKWFPSPVLVGHVHWSTALLLALVFMVSVLTVGAFLSAVFGWRMRSARDRVLDMARKQRQMREDHDRFLEMSNDLICISSREGTFLFINSAFERTLGYPKEKLLSIPYIDLVHPDDHKSTIDALAGLARGESVFHFENRYIHQDGSIVWLQWSGVLDDERGVIYGVARDVTAIKIQESIQEEQAAKAQHQQAVVFELATSQALINGDIASAAMANTRAAVLNTKVARASVWLLSEDKRELRCLDLFEQDTDTHSCDHVLLAGDFPTYFRALESRRVIDASDAHQDPRTIEFVESYFRPLGISSVLDAPIRVAGKVVGVVWLEHIGEVRHWTQDETAFVSDIADQLGVVLANKQRLRAENKFRDLLESAPDSIMIVDSQGRISLVNQQVEEMFGYRRDELLGQQIEMLMPAKFVGGHPAHVKSFFANPGRRLMGPGTELKAARKDGTEFPVEISLSPIRLDDEMFAVSAIRDVTERKAIEGSLRQHEDKVRHTQKLEAAASLANGLAHDFNNLLFAIHASVAMANVSLPDDHPARQPLENVNEAVSQARGVTRSLLTFTRREESVKKPVDLGGVVSEACDLLRNSLPASIDLQRQIAEPGEAWVHADSTHLQQVVLNLAINSRDAMLNGGQLAISVSTTKMNGEDMVLLTVQDSGVGMTKETKDRIFEPYFTTKARGQGTGLGMAVIHGIVEGHAGKITVESKVGEGTKVCVVLPRSKAPVCCAKSREAEVEAKPMAGVVLLAEDNELARGATVLMLRMLGQEVIVAADGREALEKHKSDQDRITLLVIDADMPFVSGPDCIREIRKRGCDIPALVITGGGRGGLGDELESGTTVLLKPFSLNDLKRQMLEVQS